MTDAPITPEPVNPTPAYSAPAATPAPAPAGDTFPGKTLGIVALVLSILPFQLVGIILGFVANGQSKAAGFKNTPAKAAIIVGFVLGAISIIATIAIIAISAAAVGGAYEAICEGQAPGQYELTTGETITCP